MSGTLEYLERYFPKNTWHCQTHTTPHHTHTRRHIHTRGRGGVEMNKMHTQCNRIQKKTSSHDQSGSGPPLPPAGSSNLLNKLGRVSLLGSFLEVA